ncbi:MAG: polysaccharide deacetylase family protein [Rubrivivax sp.]|nr:polysaccharide deacetylase family protein [Rubrivivax sp.]
MSRSLARRMVRLRNPQPMVSFTFDDAPHTACTQGRRLLEQHGARGTFYVCGGLTDQRTPELMHSLDELRALHAAGHELGCHGFQHVDYQSLSRQQLQSDVERNLQFLQQLGVSAQDLNFAYPFGCVSPGVKGWVARRYTSCRGVTDGLNVGETDLNLLKSCRLYEGVLTPAAVTALLEDAARQCGWLIFFTHGIEDQPTEYGCTPQLLEHALSAARQAGVQVLTVRQALQQALEQP